MVRAGCLTARFRIRLRGPSFDEWLLGDCGFVAEQALRATILIRVPKSRQHVCFNALVVDLNFEKSAELEQLSIPFVLMRDADVDTHVFQHLDTGIKVWSHALELTTSTTSACELVLHCTPKQNFGTITSFSKEEIAIKFRLMKVHDTHSII